MSENRPRRSNMGGPGGGPGGPMGRPAEKAKDFKKTIKRLGNYLKPQWLKFAVVFIFSILSTIFAVWAPKVLGRATTKLYEGLMSKLGLVQLHAAQAKIDAAVTANPLAAQSPKVIKGLADIKAGISKIMKLNGGKIDFAYIENIILFLIVIY
ncbi:MAG TPA: ABC transporter ATP-binding protein, partial [Ruminiclostridium sp.]